MQYMYRTSSIKMDTLQMQLPALAAAAQFWNLCIDYNCKTVLILTSDVLTSKELPIPKQGETVQHGNLNLRLISRESSNKLNDCDICLVSTAGSEEADRRVYKNTNAPVASTPVILATIPCNTAAFFKRLLAIHRLVKTLCQPNMKQAPVAVVARDDMEMCGLYIVVANISEMMRTQKQVDIIHTVLNVKKSLPHFLRDQSEYEQLYLAASLCTHQSEEHVVYANIL